MVLRLFSRSSTKKDQQDPKQPKGAKTAAAPPAPASDASPNELAEAVRNATSAKQRQTLISRITDEPTLTALATHPSCLAAVGDQLAKIASVEAALALTHNTEALQIELAVNTHNSDLRIAQINAITAEDSLVALEHASRSKNKACNRSTRERLETLRKARVNASEAVTEAQNLATQAMRLEQDEHLQARFDALAEKHQAAQAQHAESLDILKTFNEQSTELAPMPPPPMAAANTQDDAGPNFAALSQAFRKIDEQLRQGSKAEDCAAAMADASAAWRDAIAQATPAAGEIDVVAKCSTLFESLRNCENLFSERSEAIATLLAEPPLLPAAAVKTLTLADLPSAWLAQSAATEQRKAIVSLTKGLNYPQGVAASVIPADVAQLDARKAELTELIQACSARQAELESRFKDQVQKLDRALADGELKRAEAARGEARSLQDALPGGAANSTRKRFGSLLAKMQNLRDWQHFATDPKREELCTKMLALADAPEAPDEQAERVKDLRSQWNALGGKGPKDIAARFDEAAARAFEPCRLHYAKLAETRSANLEIRKQILEQIEQFVTNTDWASVDLSAARTILNSARTEWRNAFPVERGANKKLEKRFQAATDTLYGNLQEGWSGNLAAKEKLLASAEALLTSEDPLPTRLDAAKTLQQQWKQTGPVPRGPDQKLWKQFRAACDALFNTRDEERSAQQAEHAAQQNTANARLDDFEKAIAATAAVDIERSLLTAVRRDLDGIENLDRSVVQRARELEEKFTAKLAQKAAAEQAEKLAQLKQLDAVAAANELAGQAVADEVTAKDARFAARSAGDAHAHLDLVLEAEAAAGLDSPAQDAQRRLELQVMKLNAGMNSGARESTNPLTVADRWCKLKATAESEALRERLFTAIETLLKGTP